MKQKTVRGRLNRQEDPKLTVCLKKTKDHLKNMGHTSLSTVLFMVALTGYSQKKSLNFHILRNGNKIGTVYFSKTTSGGIDSLKVESTVKTKLVANITGRALENAVFKNGILVQSSIYRELNGDEKTNKQHRLDNGQYIISKGKKSGVMKTYPITYTMLSLYSKEPENISKVYSDNFETFLVIEKIDAHKFKITLPDDNYNYYHYKNGVLSLVEVHHSLYSANIVLVNN